MGSDELVRDTSSSTYTYIIFTTDFCLLTRRYSYDPTRGSWMNLVDAFKLRRSITKALRIKIYAAWVTDIIQEKSMTMPRLQAGWRVCEYYDGRQTGAAAGEKHKNQRGKHNDILQGRDYNFTWAHLGTTCIDVSMLRCCDALYGGHLIVSLHMHRSHQLFGLSAYHANHHLSIWAFCSSTSRSSLTGALQKRSKRRTSVKR